MSARAGTACALTALLAVLAASPGSAGNRCADGGKTRPDEGGIGGTGALPRSPEDDDSGIGGTGISTQTDVGIVGTIAGFASVCVGGLEIHYDTTTPVEVDGQSATPGALAVGQVVEVIAAGGGAEVIAREITVRHIVVGPVTRVDADHHTIEVVGQVVRLSSTTRGLAGDTEYAVRATDFPLDRVVQVSGLRGLDGTIIASRVSPSDTVDVTRLTGPITDLQAERLAIAGTTVRFEVPPPAAIGDEVSVVGRWDGEQITAGSFDVMPSIPFRGRVSRVEIEGYANWMPTGHLRVGSYLVEPPRGRGEGAAAPLALDRRVHVDAVVRDRRVILESVRTANELPLPPPRPEPPDWQQGAGEPRGPAQPPPARQPERDGAVPARPRDARPGPRPEKVGGRPERGEPPHLPEIPPRPPRPDRPPRPERPARPEMGNRPSMPQMPDRPPRPPRRE